MYDLHRPFTGLNCAFKGLCYVRTDVCYEYLVSVKSLSTDRKQFHLVLKQDSFCYTSTLFMNFHTLHN
jgi:hypothetical protein